MRISLEAAHYKVYRQFHRISIQHEQIPASSYGKSIDRLDCGLHLRSRAATALLAGRRAHLAARPNRAGKILMDALGPFVSIGRLPTTGGRPFCGGAAWPPTVQTTSTRHGP